MSERDVYGTPAYSAAQAGIKVAVERLQEQQREQEAQAAAEEAKLKAAPAPALPRSVTLTLVCTFGTDGTLNMVEGVCGSRRVAEFRANDGVDIGAAAQRTLELGALRALLGGT